MSAPVLHPAFVQLLEQGRARFNAQFALARHRLPRLEPTAFGVHLLEEVAPLISAVHAHAPERSGEVLEVLYEFSLELVGKLLTTRYPIILDGWRRVLGGLPQLLATAPRALAGSLTNGVYNLAQTPGARPQQWLDDLLRLAPLCGDVQTLLQAGQVCAWRAGLAHLRAGALELCRTLPQRLARAALGIVDGDSGLSLEPLLIQLQEDPWLDPVSVGGTTRKPRLTITHQIGSFRGLGGPFLQPPQVWGAAGRLHVTDNDRCWLLLADRFGAVLVPEETLPEKDSSAGPFKMDRKSGAVTCAQEKRLFPELKDASSWACNQNTLVVTTPLSHRLQVVALVVG